MVLEFWRMGPTPVPCREIGRIAGELEASGWDGLAVGEAHGILPDPYAALAAAACHTTTLLLGTAVAVPLRDPFLAASAMATVHSISGGRTCFSVGRGDGAMKVLQREGISVSEFEDYLRRLQMILRGEEAALGPGAGSLSLIHVLDDSFDQPKPPVDVAVTGPRMVEIGARLGDSVSFAVGCDVERLRDGITRAREARAASGGDPDAMRLGCYVQMAVVSDDDTSGRDAIRGIAMTHARFSSAPTGSPVEHTGLERDLWRDQREVAPVAGGRRNEVAFYPDQSADDEFLDRFAIIGSPERCAERLQTIVDLGITRIFIGTRSVGADPTESNSLRIGREVLPLVRT